MAKKTLAELNQLYTDAEAADSAIFSEQRSNVLLVSGDHYAKKGSRFWNSIRSSQLPQDQKLRLTKNHLQVITKKYINNIVSLAPGVGITPHNENELQDTKAAELADSVWQSIKNKHKIRAKIQEWAKDYIEIGETVVKLFFDPSKGDFVGYQQALHPETDQPLYTDHEGQDTTETHTWSIDPVTGQQSASANQPKAGETAVFSGDLVFERFAAFNVLRHPSAKSMDSSPVLILRKMTPIKDLEAMLANDPDGEDKKKALAEGRGDLFTVFDGQSGEYKQTKDQVMLREFFYRPCPEFPKGYFFITTQYGILWEGELPFGIFPIKYVGFDEVQTSPRHRSIIRQLRPYQAEINRSASKIAEHQVVLGDDKVIFSAGGKISKGGSEPGIRGIQVNGGAPTIIPGRSGEQYLPYMQSQIAEMYQVAMVNEDAENVKAELQPYTLLYRSIRDKKRFSLYGEKFEWFLVDICETALDLKRKYSRPDELIPYVGKRECINISEFQNQDKLCYQIKVEPMCDDLETMMGKQLTLTQALQYVGKQLNKEDIGRMMRAMPFVNKEEAFSDMTLDYDNAVNDILALDRGEIPEAVADDNHPYIIKKLSARMRQRDFRTLPPNVQNNYKVYRAQHMQLDAAQKQQILAAQADFIPTGGYLVGCDFYINDPEDPAKTRRARVPYESLNWLIKRLEDQGSSLSSLEGMTQGAQSQMAGMVHAMTPAGAPTQARPAPAAGMSTNGGTGLIPRNDSLAAMRGFTLNAPA